MAHVVLARALTAYIAKRFITIASLVALAVFGAVFVITWLLAHFFSAWWWLLLIPLVVAAGVVLVVRLFLLFIVRRIHHDTLTTEQSDRLTLFVDKIQNLLETRSTPLPFIILLCLKDLLLHKDIVTVKSIIRDSASLTSDYKDLEKLFN